MHKARKKRRISVDEGSMGFSVFITKYLLACFLFFILATFFAILLSLFFFKTDNPTSKIKLIALLSLYFSSFISGIIISRLIGQKHLLSGLVLGFLLFLINFTISIFVKNSEYTIYFQLLIPILTVLGAICGKKRYKAKRKRSH